MDIKLSRFCTPKGSDQAPAYTSEFKGTPAISQETNRTDDTERDRRFASLSFAQSFLTRVNALDHSAKLRFPMRGKPALGGSHFLHRDRNHILRKSFS
jgi:hypothetical protein